MTATATATWGLLLRVHGHRERKPHPWSGAIATLSHELDEAITDPLGTAWIDNKGNETSELCGVYGAPLGSTNPSDPRHSEDDQVINGGKYYTQAEFSNLAFQKLGYGKGCALGAMQVQSLAGGSSSSSSGSSGNGGASASSQSKARSSGPVVITVVNDATPTTLPADGKSTAEVALGVESTAGLSIADDPVHFGVGVRSGTGQCGTLSTSDKSTNNDGNADITYTASRSDVSCWVLATEADHGQTAQAVIYQGTTQEQSPTFVASYPTTLQAGGSGTFTIRTTNPTSTPLDSTRPHFVIFPGDGATEGYVGPLEGVTLPPHATTTYRTSTPTGATCRTRRPARTGPSPRWLSPDRGSTRWPQPAASDCSAKFATGDWCQLVPLLGSAISGSRSPCSVAAPGDEAAAAWVMRQANTHARISGGGVAHRSARRRLLLAAEQLPHPATACPTGTGSCPR